MSSDGRRVLGTRTCRGLSSLDPSRRAFTPPRVLHGHLMSHACQPWQPNDGTAWLRVTPPRRPPVVAQARGSPADRKRGTTRSTRFGLGSSRCCASQHQHPLLRPTVKGNLQVDDCPDHPLLRTTVHPKRQLQLCFLVSVKSLLRLRCFGRGGGGAQTKGGQGGWENKRLAK